MKEQTQPLTSVLGIDVSKETLDCVHLPSGKHTKVENNKDGFKQIIAFAKKHSIQLAVCEYTGAYEHKLLIALVNAKVPVAVINPAHVRYYAKSKGVMHKTDKIDAKIIAEFALERQPEPQKQRSENEIALKEFVALRRQLVKERTELKNQLEHATQRETVAITKELIEVLSKRIKKVETMMEKLIKDNSEWSKRKEILESVPGIGADTVRVLLTNMPELGEGDADGVCCLAGLVPVNRDSGKWRGKRRIFGGRGAVRTALHNAAMVAVFITKRDNVFKRMYDRLRKELHKEHNVALVAVAHKMLRIAHTLLKNGVCWEDKLVV